MENVYVEKSPKKGATWKQANKVAMHMTDTGVPNPKNPQYTIKEWDKTRPLTAMLAQLGLPKSQRTKFTNDSLQNLPVFTRKHVQVLLDLPCGYENLPKAYKDCLKLFMEQDRS